MFHLWGSEFDSKDMPWFLLYDYVEVFSYDAVHNEFNLLWRDDFDSFDEKRWHKASGGFDGSSSIFYPDNVSVKAGHLVIKMEPVNKPKPKAKKAAAKPVATKQQDTQKPPADSHHANQKVKKDKEVVKKQQHQK